MAKMAEEVAALMFTGAQGEFRESVAIRQQQTGNVLRNVRLDAFIPDSGTALLVFNGPECTIRFA